MSHSSGWVRGRELKVEPHNLWMYHLNIWIFYTLVFWLIAWLRAFDVVLCFSVCEFCWCLTRLDDNRDFWVFVRLNGDLVIETWRTSLNSVSDEWGVYISFAQGLGTGAWGARRQMKNCLGTWCWRFCIALWCGPNIKNGLGALALRRGKILDRSHAHYRQLGTAHNLESKGGGGGGCGRSEIGKNNLHST